MKLQKYRNLLKTLNGYSVLTQIGVLQGNQNVVLLNYRETVFTAEISNSSV